ncbi:MAG TPA: zf-HC2 domain-containing protein [Nocardioidaceae bacterium]|nr:zf-HC2 domain-containing protein [Nocardioidaceae bacterium]
MSHLGERLTALVDGHLDAAERDRALAHVRHCAECRADVQHQHWVRRRLQELPDAEPSAALLMSLQDVGAGAVPVQAAVADEQATRWRFPTRRHAAMAVAGAGTVAAGVLGLAYVVGAAPAAEPVRPPVGEFSAKFADVGDPPFSDAAVDAFPVLHSGSDRNPGFGRDSGFGRESLVSRR